MPMIQGIDGGLLINALRQGREDRFQDDARAFKMQQAKAEQERQAKIDDARARATGFGMPGQQPAQGGVMGQFTMPAPGRRGDTPGIAPGPQSAPQQPAPQGNQDAMLEWLVLDPDGATKYATGLKTMDEARVKKEQARNDFMGASARYLSRIPPAQRPQAFARLKPQMIGAGWTEQELANVDLSDEALMGYQAVAIDFDKIIDNDLAERQFRAGKTVATQPGGGLATVRPEMDQQGNFIGNKAEWTIKPYNEGGEAPEPAGGGDIPTITSKQDYDRLAPGKQFYDPNGVLRMKPGGAGGNTSGGFPSGQ